MGVVTYTCIEGEIISETRDGVERDYLPDPLGSTVALLDSNQNKTDAFSYWPYGEDRTSTGSSPTPYRFVGTLGYRRETPSRSYVRARHYRSDQARWMKRDPLWPGESPYGYVRARAAIWADPTGLGDKILPPNLCISLLEGEHDPYKLLQCLYKCYGKTGKKMRTCVTKCAIDNSVDKGKLDLYLGCIITSQRRDNGWATNPCKEDASSDACCSMYFYECLFKREKENDGWRNTFSRFCDAMMPARVVMDCSNAAKDSGCTNDNYLAPPIDRDWLKS